MTYWTDLDCEEDCKLPDYAEYHRIFEKIKQDREKLQAYMREVLQNYVGESYTTGLRALLAEEILSCLG